jgi:hypothetical protein
MDESYMSACLLLVFIENVRISSSHYYGIRIVDVFMSSIRLFKNHFKGS